MTDFTTLHIVPEIPSEILRLKKENAVLTSKNLTLEFFLKVSVIGLASFAFYNLVSSKHFENLLLKIKQREIEEDMNTKINS